MSWRDTETDIPKDKTKKKSWRDTEVSVPEEEITWQATESDIPGYSDTPLDTISDAIVSIPQGVTTWADEAQAGITAGGKKLLGDEAPISELYEKDLADIRDRLSLARKRSPYASAGTEVATGIGSAFIPGLGAGKLTGAGSMIARGAFEGLGSAEDKMSEEGLVQSGLGGGLSAIGSLVSGGLKKLTTGNPDAMRANVLGARTSEFKDIGIKDREAIAKELKDMGLFSNTKVDFDPTNMKFVKQGKSLESLEKPAKDKLLARLEDASSKVQDEKVKILGSKINEPVDLDTIELSIDRAIDKFAKKGSGMGERKAQAELIKEEILNDIMEDMRINGSGNATIGLIEEAKKRIGDSVGNYGKNPLLAKTPEQAQIYQMMYAEINQSLRGLMKGTKYADFNDAQHKFLTARADLAKAMASEEAQRAGVGYQGVINRISNAVAGSDEAVLGSANLSEALGKPGIKQAMPALRLGVEEAPFQAIRHISPDIPMNPQIPYAPETEEFRQGNPMRGKNPSSMIDPQQLIKFRIPRDSEEILQNPELVLAKIAQSGVNPEMYDSISYAIRESPEKVADIAPLVAAQFPTLFEDSKYGIFDGQIADPNLRAKLADDISKSDGMNSIQKAKIISNLNRNGKIPQGMV